jgi:hypothetical protein
MNIYEPECVSSVTDDQWRAAAETSHYMTQAREKVGLPKSQHSNIMNWLKHGRPDFHAELFELLGKNPEIRICIADGCDNPQRNQKQPTKIGLCVNCEARWRRGKSVGAAGAAPAIKNKEKECSVEECKEKVRCKGLCSGHYSRWRDKGDVLADVPLRPRRKGPIPPKEKKSRTTNYPSDSELIQLFKIHRTMVKVAAELGVRREYLRDYLKTRPELNKACREHMGLPPGVRQERNREAQLRWKKNNPEKVREINRNWARKRNKSDVVKWNTYNRERRKIQLSKYEPLSIEEAQIRAEWIDLIYTLPCFYCTKRDKITIDHVIPVNSSGSNNWSNLVGACAKCNFSKKEKSVKEFLEWTENNKIAGQTFVLLEEFEKNREEAMRTFIQARSDISDNNS